MPSASATFGATTHHRGPKRKSFAMSQSYPTAKSRICTEATYGSTGALQVCDCSHAADCVHGDVCTSPLDRNWQPEIRFGRDGKPTCHSYESKKHRAEMTGHLAVS